MAFVKASKKKQKARVALMGPPGSGKTYTALTVGKHLGKRIAVIDSEKGSASKYAKDVAEFDTSELDGKYPPAAYVREIKAAAAAGYDVLIIDSLSHAWEGEGGILSQVDTKGGRFDAWKDMDPQLRQLVDAILGYPGHVIVTLRTKTEWLVQQVERGGKTINVPQKVGTAPRFKDGLEYEFDVVCLLEDHGKLMTVAKTRCEALAGLEVSKPGKPFADALLTWLDDGEDRPAPAGRAESVAKSVALYETAETAEDMKAAQESCRSWWADRSPEESRQLTAAASSAKARIADRRALLEQEMLEGVS